jgi:hypothetical protein
MMHSLKCKQGFDVAVRIIPYLVGMLVAISVLRNCGVFDYMIQGLSWIFSSLGMNTDFVPAMPTALMKPFSGSGSRLMMIDSMKTYGPDSFVRAVKLHLPGARQIRHSTSLPCICGFSWNKENRMPYQLRCWQILQESLPQSW